MSCDENTMIYESLHDEVLEMSFNDMMSVVNPVYDYHQSTHMIDEGMPRFALGGAGEYAKRVLGADFDTMMEVPVKHFEEFLKLGLKNYDLKDRMMSRFYELISLAVENKFENLGEPIREV